MVYVGVDLHRKRSHVVALDPTGEVVLSRRIGNAPAEFLRIFGELQPQPLEVVFEATYGWSWLLTCWPMPASPPTWPTRWPPRRSRPLGSRTAPSTPRPWRICCGPTCWPRPGSLHRTPAFARYLIPKQTGLRLDLERCLQFYNTEGPTPADGPGPHPDEVLGKARLWQKPR
jgi:hypothetical protein